MKLRGISDKGMKRLSKAVKSQTARYSEDLANITERLFALEDTRGDSIKFKECVKLIDMMHHGETSKKYGNFDQMLDYVMGSVEYLETGESRYDI